MLLSLQFPLTDPVLIFTIILFIVLFSPLLLKKINIPDIIGLIIAGMIIGPKGLNILSGDIGLSIFGTIGLLYLMFLAGLEIDLNEFLKNKKRGAWFGILTFIVPFALGFLTFHVFLDYSVRSSLLISIMFASHTLVSYPILGRLGITNHPIVTVIIAGTIIADTIVLIILGFISDSVKGDLSAIFWIRTVAYFGIFSIYIIKILPAIAKWFFKNQESEGSLQYVFILTAIFMSAAISEFLGIEPLIGAFFAGLTLNRLIVRTSPLMNRIVFIGNTLFIPFFIISIGMRVDLRVLFQGTNGLVILIIMIIIALAGKYLAAYLTRRFFKYSRDEQNLIFGLSVSRAASTIAIIIIGYNFKVVDDLVLNNTVILIMITSLISSLYTQRSGQKIAESISGMETLEEKETEKILVPVSNPDTIQKLMEFSILIKDVKSKEPIYPITIVQDGTQATEKIALNKKMMQKALEKGAATEHKFEPVTRIDLNIVDGMLRAIKELMITKVVIGWHGKSSTLDLIFGTILDKLLVQTEKMIFVTKMTNPPELFENIHVIIPPNIQREKGFSQLFLTLRNFARNLNKDMHLYGTNNEIESIKSFYKKQRLQTVLHSKEFFADLNSLKELSETMMNNDLVVFVCSRKSAVSYHKYLENVPKLIHRYFTENNIILVYPEQMVYKSGLFNIYDINS